MRQLFIIVGMTVVVVLCSMKETALSALSTKERLLLDSINNYRAEKGLHKIQFSPKLSKVAKAHCIDLENNYKLGKICNLHSWSKKSKEWNGCCYTSDHAKAKCMWDKPKEIAYYPSEGYEIAYYNSGGFDAYRPLDRWKISKKGHNKTIINLGQWKKVKWEAIGVGLSEHYACVWFGTVRDTSGLK